MDKRISETSLISDSVGSINVLSSEFDTLSTRAKAVMIYFWRVFEVLIFIG